MDRNLHKQNQDIPVEYRNLSLHIALERADENEDWEVFNKLYRLSPKFLKNHLNMTDFIFDYNYQKLSPQKQDDLFNLS